VSESGGSFSTHPRGKHEGAPARRSARGPTEPGKAAWVMPGGAGLSVPCDGKRTQADAPACKAPRELWQIRLTAVAPRAVARGAPSSA